MLGGNSMLKWNETDLIEFFGVLPSFEEDSYSPSFEVLRANLRLVVTLVTLEGTVRVSIFCNGQPAPLFTVRRDLCTHVQITKDKLFRRCFEAGGTKHPVTAMGIPPVLERGVRVYVEPQFQVELIEPRYDIS